MIIYNYCKVLRIQLPTIRDSFGFTDSQETSPWAVEAMNALYSAGIINGKGGGVLDPKGTATRAEVAAVFMNFLEAIQ